MEVEEETISNHLEESTAATTKTVTEEGLFQNTSITDKECEKELSKLISKSNTQEEEESSDSVPKLEDSEPLNVEAVGEKEEDEEVLVHCRNSESSAALSGGIVDSVVVECTNVLDCSKVGDEGDVKEIEMPTDDVAAAECGGSEGEDEDATGVDQTGGLEVMGEKVENNKDNNILVIEKDQNEGGLEVMEEKVENNEDNNILVIEKDQNEGDEMVGEGEMEEAKEEEGAEVLKEDKGDEDQYKNEGGVNVQMENVDNVQGIACGDVRNDGVGDVQLENIGSVEGDESITKVQEDLKEGVVAEVVKEEGIVADEDTADGVAGNDEEEVDGVAGNDEEEVDGVAENEEEEVDGVAENDEEEAMAEDEEKSLDTEMETEEEAAMADEEKVQDAEIETEAELPESSAKRSGGKRKRGGRTSKASSKSPAARRKTIEEDVCFICFDGGDLVLCDRRNCPKAYHHDCVNRDQAFFESKGLWNCGWHLCSLCEKKAEYMCYTCTFSLCKACTKNSVFFCVREKEKKGLCEACMKTVMLIEKQENQGNVNFDDESSWEHLFRDYWTDTKSKHNLSLAELEKAKKKGSGRQELTQSDVKDNDDIPENLETGKTRRKAKKRKSASKEDNSSTGAVVVGSGGTSVPNNTEWASKELLELVMHMRNGDKSVQTQFDVQALLLEYINTNNLRDSSRKSQIICDARLKRLFGKPRVAHFEMLKLLESHFLIKDDSQIDDIQGTVVDTEVSQVDDDETNETLAKDRKDGKRKGRKKGNRRGPQSNREDYAAIDIHNINMIYLRRKLVEDLLDDMESFHEKIVGTFVRIRIYGANQKQDIYRLVQVTGTSKAAQYTINKRKTCTMLEILNLDKTEIVSIDTISNQEFTEDECKRLRQSIKCGLISRLTVGDILDKAMELQVARVNDWLEAEVMRLSHLRDRASDLGRKKELRECVEKLEILKKPEERARKLDEFPIINVDPTMDPDHESEDDTDPDDKKEELFTRSDSFRFNKRGRDQYSPRGDHAPKEPWTPRGDHTPKEPWNPRGDHTPKESWSGTPRSSSKNYEFSRSLSNKSFSTKQEDVTASSETHNEHSRDQGRDPFVQPPIILKKPNFSADDVASSPMETAPQVNESEKMWHYKDPSGKVQGPFSMVQLRKWSKNGYFPVGLRIWRKNEKEDDGILLTDALEGRFTSVNSAPDQSQSRNLTTIENPNPKAPLPDARHDFANLPSPTPNKSGTDWTGGQAGPSPGLHVGFRPYSGGNEGLQSPTPNNPVPHDSSGTVTVAPNNPELGIVGPVVAPADNNILPQPEMMVQPVASQNPQNWSGGQPQNIQANPAMNVAGMQPLAYNQWGGVPNMVQNPVGNFMPPEPWGQVPFPVNQPNMQQPPQPPQMNSNWGTMPSWVGPNPGNWAPPTVQGPNANPGWVMPPGGVGPVPGNMQPGWVPAPPVQGWVGAPPNPSWVGPPNPGWGGAPPVNQGPANGNTGPGWVGPPGNQGAPVANQGPGWVPPPGNQGNTNQGWGGRNRGNWGGSDRGGGYSGQRRNNRGSGFRGNNRRNYNNNNRQEPFHKDGGSFHGDSSARSSEQ